MLIPCPDLSRTRQTRGLLRSALAGWLALAGLLDSALSPLAALAFACLIGMAWLLHWRHRLTALAVAPVAGTIADRPPGGFLSAALSRLSRRSRRSAAHWLDLSAEGILLGIGPDGRGLDAALLCIRADGTLRLRGKRVDAVLEAGPQRLSQQDWRRWSCQVRWSPRIRSRLPALSRITGGGRLSL